MGSKIKSVYTAVIKKDENWWIGWIEEIPGVNCQEPTKKELIKSLKTTLKEALKMNKQEAIKSAESDYAEELVTI